MSSYLSVAIVGCVLCGAQIAAAGDSPTPPIATQTASKATQVLGFQLTTATRESARAAIKAAGATVQREELQYWYDLYDASNLLDGASRLSVGYSLKDGRLGVVEYSFPNSMDTQAVQRIGEMVATKYGKPNKATGNVGLGAVTYTWNLPDGVIVTVSRGWPNTSVALTYTVPAVTHQIDAEVAENDRAQKEAEAKKQSKNF